MTEKRSRHLDTNTLTALGRVKRGESIGLTPKDAEEREINREIKRNSERSLLNMVENRMGLEEQMIRKKGSRSSTVAHFRKLRKYVKDIHDRKRSESKGRAILSNPSSIPPGTIFVKPEFVKQLEAGTFQPRKRIYSGEPVDVTYMDKKAKVKRKTQRRRGR